MRYLHIDVTEYPAYIDCYRKISAVLENEDSIPNKELVNENAFEEPISVGLFRIESIPTIALTGNISPNSRSRITEIAKEYNYPVIFTLDALQPLAIKLDDASISIYNDKSDMIIQILQQHSVEPYYVTLYSSNLGPALFVGANIDASVKHQISALFEDTPINAYFSHPIQPYDSPLRAKKVIPPALGRAIDQLQPGSSLSCENELFIAGTLGCVLTDGEEDIGVATGLRRYSEEEFATIRKVGLSVDKSPFQIQHPAHADVVIEGMHMCEEIKQEYLSHSSQDNRVEGSKRHMKPTEPSIVGTHLLSVLGYGYRSLEDELSPQCKLDYTIFNLRTQRYSNILLENNRRASGEVASLRANLRVFKVGRSTGLTFGRVSAVKAKVKIQGYPYSTSECVVIGDRDEPFARTGDVGSSVWDEEGNLLGIIWGCCPMEGSAFVTPISDILDSLAQMTRKRYMVKKPQKKDMNKMQVLETGSVEIPDELLRAYTEGKMEFHESTSNA